MSTSTKAGPSSRTGATDPDRPRGNQEFPRRACAEGRGSHDMARGGPRFGWRERCGQEHLDENPGGSAAPGWRRNHPGWKACAFPYAASSAGGGHRDHLPGTNHRPESDGCGKRFPRIRRNDNSASSRTLRRWCDETQQVLDRLGARFKAAQRAAHLSIAEQQQVEIARALFYKSRILVMDEPTTALVRPRNGSSL